MKYLMALLALWALGVLGVIVSTWLDAPTDADKPPEPPSSPEPSAADGFQGWSVSSDSLCDWAEEQADLLHDQQKEN